MEMNWHFDSVQQSLKKLGEERWKIVEEKKNETTALIYIYIKYHIFNLYVHTYMCL